MIQIDSESKDNKGKLFELLCKYYLQWHPVHSLLYKNVWLHQDVPHEVRQFCNIPKLDGGLDAYALTFDGRYIGIQCKYQSNTSGSLSRNVFATSVDQAFSQCKNISGLVLMTTKEKLTKAAERYQVPVSGITLDSWLELEGETFEQFKAFIRGDMERSKPNPYKPRPHQSKALENANKHFLRDGNSKGKLIHPCGAGKSLTGFWLAQELKARSIVVAVPSLTLIRQTYKTWLREFKAHGEEVDWIAVCSDKTVGKLSESEQDDIVTSLLELGIESHTDPDFLSNWLRTQNGRKKIVFTTYQSGLTLSEGVKRAGFTFDLGIFDEAHKTVGQSTKLFSHLLFDENIPVRKRIFMTATERVFRGSSDEILSMDDPEVYGKTFEFFSFKEAIESDPPVLTDYKVLVLAVTQSEIKQYIEDNVLVRTKGVRWDEDVEASMLASLIALNKAHEKYNIGHTVSFHSSIAKAVAFKENQERLNELARFPEMNTYHVTGKTSTSERNREIEAFATNDNALITNARCLTEGVDVPSIDCVLFADPRQSKIDIVQAVGRALRNSKNKAFGYILLPVLVDDINTDANLKKKGYLQIVSVLKALATQDSRLVEEIKLSAQGSIPIKSQITIDSIDLHDIGFISLDTMLQEISISCWNGLKQFSWRPFKESRLFARSLGLKSKEDWKIFSQTHLKPLNIPVDPQGAYKSSGWIGWGDFLGTGRIANQNKVFDDFQQARKVARSLGIKSVSEWRALYKIGEIPSTLPGSPPKHYPLEWVSWGDWLGTGYVATFNREYASFSDALKYARSLGLKSKSEWINYCKEQKNRNDISSGPEKTYAQEWMGWDHWLGTGQIRHWDVDFYSFEEARTYVRGLNLNSRTEWNVYTNENCESIYSHRIPKDPPTYYREEWEGWGDWLGSGNLSPKDRKFRPFKDAREFVRSLKFSTFKDWKSYCKSGDRPFDIPSNPNKAYRLKGWISFGDWLGSGRQSLQKKSFLPFQQARVLVRSLGLKNGQEWRKFTKSSQFPHDKLPANPGLVYKSNGWAGLGDWLGTMKIANQNRKFLPFNEARLLVQKEGIKSQKEWNSWRLTKRPSNIPSNPPQTYKNTGWVSWVDWFGKETPANQNRKFLPFNEAKILIQKEGIKSRKDWRCWSSTNRPSNIPSDPPRAYKNTGWVSWKDWFGK